MLPVWVLGGEAPAQTGKWVNLFDERYRSQWEIIDVAKGRGHGGKSSVKDGRALLSGLKNRITGRWVGKFPTMDYEVVFEVARTAGLRFPYVVFAVGDSHGVWFMAGRDGTYAGLSTVDGKGYDQKGNPTYRRVRYAAKRWYKARLRVAGGKVEAWVDDEQVIDLPDAERRVQKDAFGVTLKPFTISVHEAVNVIRNLRLHSLGSDTK
jgi:hypothetical protein